MEQQEFSLIAGWNAKWFSHFGRPFDDFLQNKHTLPILSNSCMPIPYWKELKTCFQQETGGFFGEIPSEGKYIVTIFLFVGPSTRVMSLDFIRTPHSYLSLCDSFFLSLVVEDLFW